MSPVAVPPAGRRPCANASTVAVKLYACHHPHLAAHIYTLRAAHIYTLRAALYEQQQRARQGPRPRDLALLRRSIAVQETQMET